MGAMDKKHIISHAALHRVLGDIGDGIILTDAAETIVYMNDAAAMILSLSENVIGRNFTAVCPLVNLQTGVKFESPLGEVMREKHSRGLARNIGLALETGPVYLSATCSPILDDDPEAPAIGSSIILRDITRLRNLELRQEAQDRELRIAKSAAEQSVQTKSRFLWNMSHEILTPMNGMLGMMQLAMREPLSPYQEECLQRALGRAQDLLELIDDILDFSNLEAGNLTISEIRFDVRRLLENMVRTFEKNAQKKGLDFVIEDAATIPRYIVGDPKRYRQIARAILSNAIKFTSKGRITVGGFLGEHHGIKTLDFYVKDTGIGMGKKEMRGIFRPFTQGDDSVTRRYGGTGVGLILVRDLLKLMGGDITISSSLGIGSKISMWIPYKKAQTADEEFRERGYFINPKRGMREKTELMDASAEALLAYCKTKMDSLEKKEADDDDEDTHR